MTEKRDDLYLPSREFVEQAHIQSRAEYERMWKQSIEDPDTFWGYIAKRFPLVQTLDTGLPWRTGDRR